MKRIENKCLSLTSDEQTLYKRVSVQMKTTIDLFKASSNTEIYRTASTKAAVMLEEMLIRFIEKEDASTTNNSPAQQLYSRVI